MAARTPAVPLVAALGVMVVWGATPVATRLATDDLEPLVVAVFRTVLAGALALPLLALTRHPAPRVGGGRALLAVSSATGFVLFPVLYTLGQERTSAMHGGIILAGLPIVTGIYAALVDRRRPSHWWLTGCAIALAGEAIVVAVRAGGAASGEASLGGDLLVVLAALVVAAGYVAGARLGASGYPSLATTLWGVLLASAVLLVPGIALLATGGAGSDAAGSWVAVAFLATFTSIVGYVGWYWALARGGVTRVAPLQFLQPVSGLLLAALVLDERLTLPLALGAAAILVGVSLAQRS